MPQSKAPRAGALIVFASALAGLVVALYAYFTPLTGVNGTLGALAVIAVSVVLGVLALGLAAVGGRGKRITLRVLIALALTGNAFAASLLHEWWLCAAMAVGFVGWIIDMFSSGGAPRAAYS